MVANDEKYVAILQDAWDGKLELTQLIDHCGQLEQTRRASLAAILYQTWLRNNDMPLRHLAWFNLGANLGNQGDLPGAGAAYRQAITLAPDFIQPRLNLGTILERQGLPEQAIAEWQWVADHLQPETPERKSLLIFALNHLGRVLEMCKQLHDALAHFTRSLTLDGDQDDVIHHWVFLRLKQCLWPVYPEIAGLPEPRLRQATSALAMIAVTDDPAQQLAAAIRFVEKKVLPQPHPLAAAGGYGHRRIRIGYCSSDFCLHPVAMLMVDLFECHDRVRFEIYGYDWSPEDGSDIRRRVIAAMDQFHRIHGLTDDEAARLIREHEIDILVDLQGQTAGARMNMLAWRPAPIQITYLGLPATTGLDSIDYVIADRYLIPEEEAHHYSERPLYMPDVYQVSDRHRSLGAIPTRASCGLPEQGFIYCSFNNNYKFNPEVFDTWMNILRRVPDSVLWLLSDNPWAEANLRREAAERSIAPERLVFAPRVAPENYLARYCIADLFLDTFPFNAGTTANDALWAGLPVLTRSGRTFASRMAGALLTAANLPELITTAPADYEDKAVRLAQEPAELRRIRDHLGQVKSQGVLFDTPRFARNLEQHLLQLAAPLAAAEVRPPLVLTVEGWRGINHSFAMVNQFQLLELARRGDVTLAHHDAPLHYAHWNSNSNGAGFDSDDEALLQGIPAPDPARTPDWTYRICSPIDLRPPASGGRLAVFIVTELGLDNDSLVPGSDIRQFEERGGVVVTPSHWSRDRIIDFGFSPGVVHVIPHSTSLKYFHPLPAEVRQAQRQALGFAAQEVVLLNIGAAIWNKGIDVLLKAFAIARGRRKDLRLLFKDQRNTYGIAGDNYVQSTLANAGLLSEDVLQAITLIPANLTMEQMNSLYGLADCYVSPYRAEGFNLPVCEALACGTPVIVTEGGATDDFVGPGCARIASSLHRHVTIQDKFISAYREPDLDHLVELLGTVRPKAITGGRQVGEQSTSGWRQPVEQLLSLMG